MEILLLKGLKYAASTVTESSAGSLDPEEAGLHVQNSADPPRVRNAPGPQTPKRPGPTVVKQKQKALMADPEEPSAVGPLLMSCHCEIAFLCFGVNHRTGALVRTSSCSHAVINKVATTPDHISSLNHDDSLGDESAPSTNGFHEHQQPPTQEPARSDETAAASSPPSRAINHEDIKAKMREIEEKQHKTRRERLLDLDPNCWKEMSKDGFYQQADDDLNEAKKLELEVRGKTPRYASILHSLSALYDHRSYADSTGQQAMISYKSALFADESVKLREQFLQNPGADVESELSCIAETKILLGNSLCNFALDAATPDLPTHKALGWAEQSLSEAKERLEKIKHPQLAEAVQKLGYVYYTKAIILQGFSPVPRSKISAHLKEGESAEWLFKKCLEHYFHALGLYWERDGEEGEKTIRMMSNVALVWNFMGQINLDYLIQAEQWYKRAIEVQERVFGISHIRTKNLKADLKKIEDANKKVQGRRVAQAPIERIDPDADAKRKEENDKLMEEFLQARRKERVNETSQRFQNKLPVPPNSTPEQALPLPTQDSDAPPSTSMA